MGFLEIVGVVIVVLVIVFVAPRIVRLRIARLKALAPGELVFLFDSTRWFQEAVIKLREAGLVDEKLKTDSENPGHGPHWASASTERLVIHRGYSAQAYFSLDWSQIAAVEVEVESGRNAVSQADARSSFPGVSILVKHGDTPIPLILRTQSTSVTLGGSRRDASAIVAEINRLRQQRGAGQGGSGRG